VGFGVAVVAAAEGDGVAGGDDAGAVGELPAGLAPLEEGVLELHAAVMRLRARRTTPRRMYPARPGPLPGASEGVWSEEIILITP